MSGDGPVFLISRAGTNRAKEGLPNTPEEKDDLTEHPYHFRNLSGKLFINWWYHYFMYGFGIILMEIIGTTIFLFALMNAKYWFPGPGDNAITAAWVVAGAAFFVKLFFGRWTSTPLDMWRTIANTLTFILTRGSDMGFWELWLEPFKCIIFLVCQWLSAMIAIALLGASTDTQIKTSSALDCGNVPTPAACVIYPGDNLGVGATTVSLGWQETLGSMILYGAYVAGERYFGYSKKAHILGNALLFAAAHFIVYAQWGYTAGGSFNFWFATTTSWFSGLTDNLALFIWPDILGIGLVAITEIVFYYIYVWWWNKTTSGEFEKMD